MPAVTSLFSKVAAGSSTARLATRLPAATAVSRQQLRTQSTSASSGGPADVPAQVNQWIAENNVFVASKR